MIDVKKLKELNESGYTQREMSEILGVSRSVIQKNLYKNGWSTPNIHNSIKFDNTVFDKIDTEEKAYWLGFLYADGAVSSSSNNVELSLSASDKDHLEKYKAFLKSPKTINVSNITSNGNTYQRCRLTVTDKHFKEQLIKCGCVPQKSTILTFPSESIVPKKFITHFVRGYIDGDGCISFTKTGRLVLQIIGTKEFLLKIQELFPEFKVLRKDKRWKDNTYCIGVACSNADKILTILYKDSTIFLQRKYNRLAVLSSNW